MVCADSEGLVLRVVIVVLGLGINLRECHGTTGADTTGCNTARPVAENVALWQVSMAFSLYLEYITYSNNVEEADDDGENARRHQ